MRFRDQNNGKKIGINGSQIYHVTTLPSTKSEEKRMFSQANLFSALCHSHAFLDLDQSRVMGSWSGEERVEQRFSGE